MAEEQVEHPSKDRQRAGVIALGPAPGGWRVEAAICGQALVFLSGAAAEQYAHELARKLSSLGYDTRLEIKDRRDSVAGSFRYPAATTFAGDDACHQTLGRNTDCTK
jgi:hypothetical protein